MAEGDRPGRGSAAQRLVRVARSPYVRWGFLALAVVLLGLAVASQWEAVLTASARVQPWAWAVALVSGLAFVALTMSAWRTVLADLGFRMPWGPAFATYAVSQLGKYIPGGVWNIAAAAELGADHRAPRRLVVSTGVVATVVTLVSGLAVGSVCFVVSPEVARQWAWLAFVGVPLLVLLVPPVLNRIVGLAFRVLRTDGLVRGVSYRGMAASVGITIVAWIAAGAQLWVLVLAMGVPPSVTSAVLCIGASALGWAAGFIVVFAPAGIGVREAVTVLVLAPITDTGTALAAVVLSRILLIAADGIAAATGVPALRASRRSREQGA